MSYSGFGHDTAADELMIEEETQCVVRHRRVEDIALWNVLRRGGEAHRKGHGVGFSQQGLLCGCWGTQTTRSGPSALAVTTADS